MRVKSSDYLKGTLKIDEYVTHHRKFEEINEGFHDMHVRRICNVLFALFDHLSREGNVSDASLTCLERQ